MCSASIAQSLAVDSSFDSRGQATRLPVVLLPLGHVPRELHLHGRHFVFGTTRRPVRKFRGHHVRASHGVVKRGVNHAGLHALGDSRGQRDIAGAAGERDQIAVLDATILSVRRMDFEHVHIVPDVVIRAARLRAHVVLREDAPGGEDQREAAR